MNNESNVKEWDDVNVCFIKQKYRINISSGVKGGKKSCECERKN